MHDGYRTSPRCRRIAGIAFLTIAVGLAQGCATSPHAQRQDRELYEGNVPAVDDGTVGTGGRTYSHPAVAAASRVAGAPYRYGGHTPLGFDCSGLVFYAYNQAGIAVPRTTDAQLRSARNVPLDELRPGDVLFFELSGSKVSHVGIYTGGGSFIHAPSSGKKVSYSSLESEYWRYHLISAGRFN